MRFRLKPAVGQVVVVVGLLSMMLALAPLASAHSSLRAATPAPGLLTGPFDKVELEFFDAINPDVDLTIQLRDSDGSLLDGYLSDTELLDEFTMRSEVLKPLPAEGQYLIFYMIETNDDDGIQEAGYEFFYDPGSDAEALTAIADGEESGASGLELAGIGLALLGVIGLLFWFSPWFGRSE